MAIHAPKLTVFVNVSQRAGKGPFGAFLPRNGKLIGSQGFLPFGGGFLHPPKRFSSPTTRRVWVVFLGNSLNVAVGNRRGPTNISPPMSPKNKVLFIVFCCLFSSGNPAGKP